VPLCLAANIQLCPLTVPVERDGVRALVQFVQATKVFIFYGAQAVDVEKAERNLVFSIGLAENVLEVSPVSKRQLALVCPVSDVKQDRVLFPLDFVLWTDSC